MSLRVIKLRTAIAMNVVFLFLGYFLASNVVTVQPKRSESLDKRSFSAEHVALILSAPTNVNERLALRKSWLRLIGNSKKYKFKHFFSIGRKHLNRELLDKIETEHEMFGDIMFLEIEDSYAELTRKTLASIKWLSENVDNLKYIIKCDDDSFVRINLIVDELISREKNDRISNPEQHLYWGYFKGNAHIKTEGKWAEPNWFLCDRYLPYTQGGGYVISNGIADYITRNSDLLQLYNSEDVAMGVWTAPLANVHRLHDSRFDTEWISRGCNDSYLIRHKQSPDNMLTMYNNLIKSNGNKLCTKIRTIREPYEYNWKISPSKCCIPNKQKTINE